MLIWTSESVLIEGLSKLSEVSVAFVRLRMLVQVMYVLYCIHHQTKSLHVSDQFDPRLMRD